MALTPEQVRRFHARGFLVLDGALPAELVERLCAECERLQRTYSRRSHIEQGAGCILEPLGALVTGKQVESYVGLTRVDYLALRGRFNDPRVGAEFLFGPVLRDILEQLMGADLYLFNEQYIVKTPHAGQESKFVMHQDSQYVHQVPQEEVPPYVSVWCALDDVSEENGCLYILPYPALSDPTATQHINDDPPRFSSPDEMRRHHLALAKAYDPDLQGGTDEVDGEIPILLNRGSIVILSSLVYHRSGANIADDPRRAYMPQFSWGPIQISTRALQDGNGTVRHTNVAFAVPLHEPPLP